MTTDDATVRLSRGTSRASGGAQFAPGTIIGDRYRIASLLGAGGMGEVYRADDLKLDQQVALKFLPAALANDPHYLEQLHAEVRLGRQVAHPNVCHLYDIGESAGMHFVAMEYVDGEDLGRLLRRIGRLAHDKAVEIARGIAGGLAAAHAKGILHRDLKPANIMIDSRGEPRITDFGLALTHDDATAANQAGTPAYMAPEQLHGAPATVRTDIYALGLVLYEIFTGRRAREAATLAELRSESGSAISLPSAVVRDIDSAIERVIVRCLDPDPSMRPRSAREVFNALPGGDPLAAALAAGETPSPRLVAAAGTEGTLSPRAAWSCVAAIVVMLAGVILMMRGWSIATLTPMELGPPELEARALDYARIAGIPAQRFRAARFERNFNYLTWLDAHDRSKNPWSRLRSGPQPLTLRVRQSPAPLVPQSLGPLTGADDPPENIPGMSDVQIDTLGHLVSLRAYPSSNASGHADWNALLDAAGVDRTSVRSVPPRELPPFYADARVAWDAQPAGAPGIPLHIEAASAAGVPVWFFVGGPWSKADDQMMFSGPRVELFLTIVGCIVCVMAALLAWNNYRRRRIDRSAVTRAAITIFTLECISFFLLARHYLNFQAERSLFTNMLGSAFAATFGFAMLYSGLEPYVRRRWPELLISWLRLIGGKLRDPMVGRDLLFGITAGVAHAFIATASNELPVLFGGRMTVPRVSSPESLDGFSSAVGAVVGRIHGMAVSSLAVMVLLVLASLLFRRRAIAISAIFILQVIAYVFAARGNVPVLLSGVFISLVFTAILVRIGFLASATMQFVFTLVFVMPLPLEPSGWMFAAGFIPLLTLLAFTAYAFVTSLGGQPAFSASLLDD